MRVKPLLILLTCITSAPILQANKLIEPGSTTISSQLTSKEASTIPLPGYDFSITIEYKNSEYYVRPEDEMEFRQFEATATLPAAAPALAYLGKALLEISNWTTKFCTEKFGASSGWIFNDYTIIQHKNLTQALQFRFLCS